MELIPTQPRMHPRTRRTSAIYPNTTTHLAGENWSVPNCLAALQLVRQSQQQGLVLKILCAVVLGIG